MEGGSMGMGFMGSFLTTVVMMAGFRRLFIKMFPVDFGLIVFCFSKEAKGGIFIGAVATGC